MQYDKREMLWYTVRGKKSFPVTTNGLLSFNIKGRCDVDKEFKAVGVFFGALGKFLPLWCQTLLWPINVVAEAIYGDEKVLMTPFPVML